MCIFQVHTRQILRGYGFRGGQYLAAEDRLKHDRLLHIAKVGIWNDKAVTDLTAW